MLRRVWLPLGCCLGLIASCTDLGSLTSGTKGDAGQPDSVAMSFDGCMPQSCASAGWACGAGNDGCGGLLDCGPCLQAGTTCDATSHKCICTPQTCTTLGAACGTIGDGCGSTLDCGSCPSGQTCGGGGDHKCGTTPCVPGTCRTGECGDPSDGCGNVLMCASCPTGQVCGAPDAGFTCCTPATCGSLGWKCGTGPDGCGGMLSCGTCQNAACQANHTCSACVPSTTCASAGYQCGSFVDSCGVTETCGPVPSQLTQTTWCPSTQIFEYCPSPGCASPGSRPFMPLDAGTIDAGTSDAAPDAPLGSPCGLPGPTPPEPGAACMPAGNVLNAWCCN